MLGRPGKGYKFLFGYFTSSTSAAVRFSNQLFTYIAAFFSIYILNFGVYTMSEQLQLQLRQQQHQQQQLWKKKLIHKLILMTDERKRAKLAGEVLTDSEGNKKNCIKLTVKRGGKKAK